MARKRGETQGEKFSNEIASVLIRWTEESDLKEHEMEQIAYARIERFFTSDVDFNPDPDFLDGLNEDFDEPPSA